MPKERVYIKQLSSLAFEVRYKDSHHVIKKYKPSELDKAIDYAMWCCNAIALDSISFLIIDHLKSIKTAPELPIGFKPTSNTIIPVIEFFCPPPDSGVDS